MGTTTVRLIRSPKIQPDARVAEAARRLTLPLFTSCAEAPLADRTAGCPLVRPGSRGRSLVFSGTPCPSSCEAGQPRFHGSGACELSPGGIVPLRLLAKDAWPQPDRLGHLVSPGRLAVSGRSLPVRPCCSHSHVRAEQRRRNGAAERPACAGPLHPGPQRAIAHLRQDRSRDPCPGCQGRFTASSAKKTPIRSTRGAFHPWDTPLRGGREASRVRSLDADPQIVPNLWITGLAPLHSAQRPVPLTGQRDVRTRPSSATSLIRETTRFRRRDDARRRGLACA